MNNPAPILEPNMDDISRGAATAALTLQSVLLQALAHKGVITREDALGIVDRSLEAAAKRDHSVWGKAGRDANRGLAGPHGVRTAKILLLTRKE
jgi:hypothetical protein